MVTLNHSLRSTFGESLRHQSQSQPLKQTIRTNSARLEFDEGRRKLYDLLERVEGCSHVTDVPTRFLLHDGALVEMDIAENTALHRVHGYLMNDGFMVATWLPNRRGPVRCAFDFCEREDGI